LETRATRSAAAGDTQVGIDNLNLGSVSTESMSTLGQRILEPKALLLIENLLRAGLAGVDDGLTLEMVGLNMLGRCPGEPPVR
jgi:hypothetical protein